MLIKRLFQLSELNINAVFLAPLQELGLEIDLLISDFVNINQLRKDAFLHKFHTGTIPTVKIYRTDQCLKSIAPQVAVMRCSLTITHHHVGNPHLLGEFT